MDKPTKATHKQEKVFEKSSGKTYNLVEIVKAPTIMVDKGPDDTVFAFPIVAIIEMLLTLGVTALLLVFSLIQDAPLEEIANPLITTDPAKAPWYFMGLQELLEHMHPFVAGIALPGIIVAFFIALPYLDNDKKGAGRWFTSKRGKRITFWTAIYTIIAFPAYVVLDNAFPVRELLRGKLPDIIAQSIIPGTVLFILAILPVLFIWRFGKGTKNIRELVLAFGTMIFFAAIVLTIIGFFFRGPGFELYFPWDMPGGYNPLDNL